MAGSLLVGFASPAQASSPGDGSQPLPGYTVDNPPLAPLQTPAGPTTVQQGVYRHAAYDFEVPPHWNGDLVMWAHPYQGQDPVLTLDAPEFGLRQLLADTGYAWAGSSYQLTGFDVGSGVTSEHDLAVYVSGLLAHRPKRIFLVGISMGGQVVARSIEQYPHFYSGALPMCGSLGDDRLFDYILDENLVAQDLAGIGRPTRRRPTTRAGVVAFTLLRPGSDWSGLTPGGASRPPRWASSSSRSPRSGRPVVNVPALTRHSYWCGTTGCSPSRPAGRRRPAVLPTSCGLAQNLTTRIGSPNRPGGTSTPPCSGSLRLRLARTGSARAATFRAAGAPGRPDVPVLTLHDTR